MALFDELTRLTNPIHFRKSILATIEHGHANHTCNDYSSTAYWYQLEPHKPHRLVPVAKRLLLLLDFANPKSRRTSQTFAELTPEMSRAKAAWARRVRRERNR